MSQIVEPTLSQAGSIQASMEVVAHHRAVEGSSPIGSEYQIGSLPSLANSPLLIELPLSMRSQACDDGGWLRGLSHTCWCTLQGKCTPTCSLERASAKATVTARDERPPSLQPPWR